MQFQLKLDQQVFNVTVEDVTARPVIAVVDGQRFEVWPETMALAAADAAAKAAPAVTPAPRPSAPTAVASAVLAPLPGAVVKLSVAPGDTVNVGQALCAIEAMKMQNVIRATRAGKIASIAVSVGQVVKHRDVLMQYAE